MGRPMSVPAGRLGAVAVGCLSAGAAGPLIGPGADAGALLPVGVGTFLLVFSSVCVAMSRRSPTAGALYAYAARGVGRAAGLGVAWAVLCAYHLILISIFCRVGMLAGPMVGLRWWAVAAGCWAVVAVSGMLRVAVAAVMVLVGGQLGLFLWYAKSATLTEPLVSGLSRPALGSALLVVLLGFVGFEAGLAFREEARGPVRLYLPVFLLAVVFAAGVEVPPGYTVGALVAAAIVLQHAIIRYLVVLGRERVFPRGLVRVRVAALTPTVVGLAGISVFYFAGTHPGGGWAARLALTGGLGVLLALAAAALGALLFLNRHPAGEGWWRRLAAPLVSTVGFGVALWLAAVGHRELVIAAAAPVLVGLAHAGALRWAAPVTYAGVGLGGTAIVVAPSPGVSPPQAAAAPPPAVLRVVPGEAPSPSEFTVPLRAGGWLPALPSGSEESEEPARPTANRPGARRQQQADRDRPTG